MSPSYCLPISLGVQLYSRSKGEWRTTSSCKAGWRRAKEYALEFHTHTHLTGDHSIHFLLFFFFIVFILSSYFMLAFKSFLMSTVND